MNKTETIVQDMIEEGGGIALHKGAPDFFCFNNGRYCWIEVKLKNQPLQRHQKAFISLLLSLGMTVFIVRFDKYGIPSDSLKEAIRYLNGDDASVEYPEFTESVKLAYAKNKRKPPKRVMRSVKRAEIPESDPI